MISNSSFNQTIGNPHPVGAIFTIWMFFLQEETSKETSKEANRSGEGVTHWSDVEEDRFPQRKSPPKNLT